jgi:hypothetical protein
MSVSKMTKIRQPLRALRLTEAHKVRDRLVDVVSPIAFGMSSEVAQHRVMKRSLRGKCGVRGHGVLSFSVVLARLTRELSCSRAQ